MKVSVYPALIALLLVAVEVPRARAERPPASARLPVIAIEIDGQVSDETMTALLDTVASPTLPGSELADRLDLLRPPALDSVVRLEDFFERAQDDFFSGAHARATRAFQEIVRHSRTQPALLAVRPALRKTVHHSLLHLAIIHQSDGETERAAGLIRAAALEFPELSADKTEFPPWLCRQFEAARQALPPPEGQVVLEAPPGCQLFLSGRSLGTGERFDGIRAGEYAAAVQCGGRQSLVQRLTVGAETVAFRPVMVLHSRADYNGSCFRLVPQGAKLAEKAAVADALALARAGKWPRLLALVRVGERRELWLVDSEIGGVVRRSPVKEKTEGMARGLAEAVTSLAQEPAPETAEGSPADEPESRPWYRNPLAWTLVGAGAALLGTGIGLRQAYAPPSEMDPLNWSLIVAGAGAATTGTVLFFVPFASGSGSGAGGQERLALGVATGVFF